MRRWVMNLLYIIHTTEFSQGFCQLEMYKFWHFVPNTTFPKRFILLDLNCNQCAVLWKKSILHLLCLICQFHPEEFHSKPDNCKLRCFDPACWNPGAAYHICRLMFLGNKENVLNITEQGFLRELFSFKKFGSSWILKYYFLLQESNDFSFLLHGIEIGSSGKVEKWNS